MRQTGRRLDCSLPSRMRYTSHYGAAQNSLSSVHMLNNLLHALEGWDTLVVSTEGLDTRRLLVKQIAGQGVESLAVPSAINVSPTRRTTSPTRSEPCWALLVPPATNAKGCEVIGRAFWLLTRWVALGTGI